MMDIRLALMTGVDIPIPQLQLILHQPTIKEISFMGEDDLFIAMQYLCLDKEQLIQDKSALENLTNFQVFMKVLGQQSMQEKKAAIVTLLSLLFPSYNPIFLPNSILLNSLNGENPLSIDENNFGDLQEVVKQVLCVNNVFQGDNIIYNPVNDTAKKIADKIMKGRQKVAEINNKGKESILTRYLSILTIGVSSMSIWDCLDLTLYQLFDLVERYNLYTDWDIDLRVRLAGGSPKSEAENWMKNIH